MHYFSRGLKQSKRLYILLTFLVVALGAPLVTSVPAHAASLCSGSLIASNSISSNGTAIGELDVYYNSYTGENCAITQSGGPSWGVQKSMTVYLTICQQASAGWSCGGPSSVYDSGNYYYYAGIVGIGARGQCIYAAGSIVWNGVRNWAYAGPAFCGS